uniref:Uncharacterized protein n=1 Tax=Timema monikensis TaxID=170555 RepID=A0A7R9E769_9NEOP|nr:unnamed protein product [Timema monikensis]
MNVRVKKLDQNDTKDILPERFKNTHRLRNLRLDGNQLDSIPTKALEPLIYLEALADLDDKTESGVTCRHYFLCYTKGGGSGEDVPNGVSEMGHAPS